MTVEPGKTQEPSNPEEGKSSASGKLGDLWRRRRGQLLALALVVVLAGGGYLAWSSVALATSGYVAVERQDTAETVLATGQVTGKTVTPLGFEGAGTVDEVRVEEGDRVSQGQVLAVQENRQQRLRVSREEQAVVQAREDINQAQAQLRAAQANYDFARGEGQVQAREALKQAEIQAETAEDLLDRYEELHEAGLVSETDLEEAEENWKLAESAVKQAESEYEGRHVTVEEARSELARARSNVAMARSLKEQAQIGVEEARLDYQDTYLEAPFAGQVNRLEVSAGEHRQPGEEVLTLVPDAPATVVEVQVDEDLVGAVEEGQEALVTTSAFPEEEYQARVARVAPGIDAERGTFEVRLELEDWEEELVTDLAVFAEVVTRRLEEAVILEQRLVQEENGDSYVYVKDNGRVALRQVQAEDLGNEYAHIREGLEEGERVLTSLDLEPGQRVRAVDEEE